MKKIYLNVLLLLLSFFSFSQKTKLDSLKSLVNTSALSGSSNTYAPNYTPLSPNAAAFQKHGDYQVNLATGVPDISIPLYTIEEGILKNPIVLRYHASGHKIADLASLVGWGFSLDYGASLNRAIINSADDKAGTGSYLNNPIVSRDLCNNGTDYTYCSAANQGVVDFEPDLFSFSAGSSNGKFMLRHNGQTPFLMPWQAVSINEEYAANSTLSGFSLANPDGSYYHFGITYGGYGGTETQRTLTSSGSLTDNGIATWQIGKISDLNSNHQISFQYQKGGKVNQTVESWGANITYNDSGTPTSLSVQPQVSIQSKQVEESNISKIFFTNGEVEFVNSNVLTEPRADIPESSYLKEIKVYSYEAGVKTQLKSITFHYSYFKDRTNSDGRLKLDSLRIFGVTGTVPQVYRFDYITNTYSWRYTTSSTEAGTDWTKQDYFGYFNNKPNNHLIDISSYNGVSILSGTADRSSVETYMKEGVLSKITYSTGGSSVFDFEANRYKNNQIEVLGGGLRVKTIKHFDGLGNQASMKSYSYSSDAGAGIGKLNSIWSFPSTGNVGEYQFLSGVDYLYLYKSVSLGSSGLAEMSSHDGTPVYYTLVREYNEAVSTTTNNGYTDYTFSYEPDVIVNTPWSLIRDIKPWKRGLLLTKSIYKEDNSLLHKTINTYSSFKYESITNMGKVRFMNQANINCATCGSGMPNGFNTFPNACQFPQLSYLTGQNKTGQEKLVQSVEQSYSGIYYIENSQQIQYDAYLQQRNLIQFSSKGDSLRTNFQYPYDYSSSPYTEMLSSNYIQPVIVETNYFNGGVTFKKSSDYTTNNNHYVLQKIRTKLSTGTEITPITFDTYDTRGNLTQYTHKSGQITLLDWYAPSNGGKIDLLKKQTIGGGSTGTVLQRSTSYDYTALVGEKSLTDINGYSSTYAYDNFQRLQNIKDSQSYLLKDFNYHYANQAALTGLGITPNNNLNYLVSRTAREAQTGTSLSSTVENTTTEISYLDGLGRGLQSQIWKGSPDQTKDIITQTSVYDAYGRANKSILTTPSDGILGAYKSTALALANSFYADTCAYTQTFFESSPLNRPLKQFGVGQAWKAANKHTFFQYLLAGDGIKRFDVSTDSTVTCSNSYSASSLLNDCIKSEQGVQSYVLKDKQGRITHKYQEMESGFAITGYVYDDVNGGRLAYVIPPETYKKLGTGLIENFKKSQDIFKEGIFSYAYDGIGNLIEKHIPGGGTTRYVLDKYDRIVLENDDKDSSNLWKMTKYDALGRPILKGILTNIGVATRQTVQNNFGNFGNVNTNYAYEDRGTDLLGYTNRSFPTAYPVTDANIKHVIYYDDYTTWQADVNYNFNVANAFHAQGLAKGLMTGQFKRNLKTGAWQKFVYYYDYRGKLIQEFYLSNRGNIIRKDYQYRFNGELLKVRIEKKSGGNVISTKILTYQYDHLGRKVKYNHFLNGTDKSIATYGYDDIGRLNKKSFSPISVINSLQTGSWNATTTWIGSNIPTLSDNVTINTGHIVTINTGEAGSAGSLFDKGKLTNNGSFYLGSLKPATTATELHSLNYKYHIRGLRGINLDANNDLTNSLFSFKLTYEEDGTYYDGNIRNQYWKSSIDGIQRAYQYTYDKASRLTGAAYGSGKAGEDYALNSVSYDDNGNIKTLSRNGATNSNYTAFGNVDNLTYTYQTNSNKLQKIADATTTNADLGDFRDANNTDNDYTYWQDGSLKKDKNKKIASITYNYLKLPEVITFENARTVTTEYDAGGTKLKKIDSNGETTDYEEDEIYVNGNLYQTSHDEGRIANGIYEYNITDHNNDLRVSFRDSLGIAVPTQSIFYDPWGLSMKGMAITRNPTNLNKYQFLNRETQFETGYIDLIHRQFDPQIGRFTSQDGVIEGQEHLSLYQYGWNNPILKPDPDGLEPPCCGGPIYGFQLVQGVVNNFNKILSYTDVNDATVLATTLTRGENAINVDGTKATTTDKVMAGVGAAIPIVSGSALKKIGGAIIEGVVDAVKGGEKVKEISPNVKKILNTIEDFKKDGGKVQVNALESANKQELNMTFKNTDGSKLDLRVESHDLPQSLGGKGKGSPVRHMNAEVTNSGGNTVKMKHIKGGHKALE